MAITHQAAEVNPADVVRTVPIEEQIRLIKRGTVDLIGEAELAERLEECEREGRPLRVKLGIDPSSPDIHVGHTVVLRKLRDFQRLGHQIIMLWGTATAMVGDPSGKNKTRPQLTKEMVDAHKATYKAQISAVLDMATVEERENSEWFDSMNFMDCIKLSATFTVARILERDSFMKRYKAGQPISIHEFLYPLMQGWDSVELKADVEIGGNDQLFNLLVGRELQKQQGQKPQICLTTPIIEGLDGVQKMSKSLGNYIGVADPPSDMFGKCMSIPDALMDKYFTTLTDIPEDQVRDLLAGHPRAAKVTLAREIVAQYHSPAAADRAVEEFDRVFKQGGLPDEIPVVDISADQLRDGCIRIANALAVAEFCKSSSAGRRLIEGGSVRLDHVMVTDVNAGVGSGSFLLQCGKRKVARIRVP